MYTHIMVYKYLTESIILFTKIKNKIFSLLFLREKNKSLIYFSIYLFYSLNLEIEAQNQLMKYDLIDYFVFMYIVYMYIPLFGSLIFVVLGMELLLSHRCQCLS